MKTTRVRMVMAMLVMIMMLLQVTQVFAKATDSKVKVESVSDSTIKADGKTYDLKQKIILLVDKGTGNRANANSYEVFPSKVKDEIRAGDVLDIDHTQGEVLLIFRWERN